jgi:hypothetical protein
MELPGPAPRVIRPTRGSYYTSICFLNFSHPRPRGRDFRLFVIGAGNLDLPIKIELSGAGLLPGAAMILMPAAFQAITAVYILETLINMKTPKELTGATQEVLGRWAGLLVYA